MAEKSWFVQKWLKYWSMEMTKFKVKLTFLLRIYYTHSLCLPLISLNGSMWVKRSRHSRFHESKTEKIMELFLKCLFLYGILYGIGPILLPLWVVSKRLKILKQFDFLLLKIFFERFRKILLLFYSTMISNHFSLKCNKEKVDVFIAF